MLAQRTLSGHLDKGTSQRLYNYRHSRARIVVENSFGLLASVFHVFRKPLMINLENAEIVTKICIYLHNFLRRIKTSRTLHCSQRTLDNETQDGKIIPGSWRAVVQGDTGLLNLTNRARRANIEAKELRKEFMRYFQSDDRLVRTISPNFSFFTLTFLLS
ncbi:unnamed protein product [Acanthoscelides obtectus]|uniref:DDE Tnp4 domain-containing protein n=1 Tax=Acanthoscelides obtectus TaxID=200917 RepID=A0A9P0JPS8_ACAOB|nr:unnamed protein product [Acanthoscelides obtectus]CAK1667048.1 hypothetical protein AOBTE_LOCUS25641 [Acanthoscelides obtectus]